MRHHSTVARTSDRRSLREAPCDRNARWSVSSASSGAACASDRMSRSCGITRGEWDVGVSWHRMLDNRRFSLPGHGACLLPSQSLPQRRGGDPEREGNRCPGAHREGCEVRPLSAQLHQIVRHKADALHYDRVDLLDAKHGRHVEEGSGRTAGRGTLLRGSIAGAIHIPAPVESRLR